MELAAVPWRRARKLARNGLATQAELHELRLALKHCRYALEPLTALEPDAATRLLKRLRSCQDSLGEYRDVELAAEWLDQQGRALAPQFTASLEQRLQSRRKALRRRAMDRIGSVWPAYDKWRGSVRKLTRAAMRGRPSP